MYGWKINYFSIITNEAEKKTGKLHFPSDVCCVCFRFDLFLKANAILRKVIYRSVFTLRNYLKVCKGIMENIDKMRYRKITIFTEDV